MSEGHFAESEGLVHLKDAVGHLSEGQLYLNLKDSLQCLKDNKIKHINLYGRFNWFKMEP